MSIKKGNPPKILESSSTLPIMNGFNPPIQKKNFYYKVLCAFKKRSRDLAILFQVAFFAIIQHFDNIAIPVRYLLVFIKNSQERIYGYEIHL